jgi:hypothetical protein
MYDLQCGFLHLYTLFFFLRVWKIEKSPFCFPDNWKKKEICIISFLDD